MRGGIDHHVPHRSNIVHGAIDLEGVVVEVGHIIVVIVDRHRAVIPVCTGRIKGPLHRVRAVRVSVSLHINAVVEVGDIIVCNDMALAVNPHRRIGLERHRKTLPVNEIELIPEVIAVPTLQMIGVIAADEIIVGDIKILRARIAVVDALIDILKTAVLDGQADGPGEELHACLYGDFRIAEGDAFKIIVLGIRHIEQSEIPAAVKDNLAVAGRFDDDGFVRRPLAEEIIGPFHGPG